MMCTGVLVNLTEFQILFCYHHHQTITNQQFHQCAVCLIATAIKSPFDVLSVDVELFRCLKLNSTLKVSQQSIRYNECRNCLYPIHNVSNNSL